MHEFNYRVVLLKKIGGEGVTNFPIAVRVTRRENVVVVDNRFLHANVFSTDGILLKSFESCVKHGRCFAAVLHEGFLSVASDDGAIYTYDLQDKSL